MYKDQLAQFLLVFVHIYNLRFLITIIMVPRMMMIPLTNRTVEVTGLGFTAIILNTIFIVLLNYTKSSELRLVISFS